jgi:dynein heavy chain
MLHYLLNKYKKVIPEIHRVWLKTNPSEEDILSVIENCFTEGLQCIQAFERWSKHPNMKLYADALEEWDDRVGGDWEAPDNLHLNPIDWIKESKLHSDRDIITREVLNSCFSKIHKFAGRFQPILEIFWRNKQANLKILVHERLRNPTDSLLNTIKLFDYQRGLFTAQIPTSTNVGCAQLDSKKTRDLLIPSPKECLKELEQIIPKITREKLDEAEKWLTD